MCQLFHLISKITKLLGGVVGEGMVSDTRAGWLCDSRLGIPAWKESHRDVRGLRKPTPSLWDAAWPGEGKTTSLGSGWLQDRSFFPPSCRFSHP